MSIIKNKKNRKTTVSVALASFLMLRQGLITIKNISALIIPIHLLFP